MSKETPVINILTYRLPFELANQIYNEYQSRVKEARFLLESYKKYSSLKDNLNSVELFIALSVFHRRVIANFDGAVKFYSTVTRNGDTDVIRIGGYDLNSDEKNKLLAVVISYNKLLEKFSIPPSVMEYYETREFLQKIITLKSVIENASTQRKQKGKDGKGKSGGSKFSYGEDDLPF